MFMAEQLKDSAYYIIGKMYSSSTSQLLYAYEINPEFEKLLLWCCRYICYINNIAI